MAGEVNADQLLFIRELLHRRIFGQVGIGDAEQLVRPADGIEQTHLSGDNAAVHPGDGLQPALGGGCHPAAGKAEAVHRAAVDQRLHHPHVSPAAGAQQEILVACEAAARKPVLHNERGEGAAHVLPRRQAEP